MSGGYIKNINQIPILFEKYIETIIAIQIISLAIIPQVIDKIFLSKFLFIIINSVNVTISK